MSNFAPAFERMMINEGGYQLTNDPRDRGGMTYAGISRRAHPDWPGWQLIDRGATPSAQMVRDWYANEFWFSNRLDEVQHQLIAQSIFDFGVNAGLGTAAKLAQIVVGVTPDGRIGPVTLRALNAADPTVFSLAYTLAKIGRYRDIVQRDRTQMVFLLGWLNRALKEAA